jgi:hypothetical protein
MVSVLGADKSAGAAPNGVAERAQRCLAVRTEQTAVTDVIGPRIKFALDDADIRELAGTFSQ